MRAAGTKKPPKKVLAETDLYAPVRDYLEKQGYTVRGEVHNCDIAATKGDDLIVVELKRTLNIPLLVQAVQRQKITESVYVAIPRPANKLTWMRQSSGVHALLRRLEVGLILVSVQRGKPPVEVIFHPLPCERRRRKAVKPAVIQERERRSGDFNEGGCCRRKLVTAYRENALHIACCLADLGPLAPRRLRQLGTGDKTLAILSRNVYSWFERVDRGVYSITSRGRTEMEDYPALLAQFREALPSGVIGL